MDGYKIEKFDFRARSLFPHKNLGKVGEHSLPVQCVDICNDGRLIASASHDEVKFWNVKYFEDMDVSQPTKGNKNKLLKHNLPSSETGNASDFFADL